jgi:hypothetical protein
LQAGGHRFDPGWLHSRNPCVRAGFDTTGHASALAANGGWKRFGSLRALTGRLLCAPVASRYRSASSPSTVAGRWCAWPDRLRSKQKRRRGTSRSPTPHRRRSRFHGKGRLRHRSRQSRRAWADDQAQGKRAKARGHRAQVGLRHSSMNPSVSPQGEAGGDEAAAKAPRQIKHDRGWPESPMSNTNRSCPGRQ